MPAPVPFMAQLAFQQTLKKRINFRFNLFILNLVRAHF